MINKLFSPSNIKDHLKYNLNNSLALYLYLIINYINLSMIHVLFYSRQRLLFPKLVNLITKPNLKSKNLYLNRPYYYSMKPKKFYNMQRVVAKILIVILLYVYYIIYPVLIEIYGLCPNAPPIFKVFYIFIIGLIFNLDNQITSLQSSISSAQINENSY